MLIGVIIKESCLKIEMGVRWRRVIMLVVGLLGNCVKKVIINFQESADLIITKGMKIALKMAVAMVIIMIIVTGIAWEKYLCWRIPAFHLQVCGLVRSTNF